ncbi:MAG: hypothetical protein PHD06_01015 [Bacteroidales bacterium]|nr:hypothetical protein [Bacteroidales bacterium]MDD4383736.1 hypothetical protein [Bacteroidales bacterium]MDY0196268.1 hypothetical protein [Tenuifilaceae bacterium]
MVKTVLDGSIIEFDKGSFDDWCVYLTRKGESRFAPKDIQYFTELDKLGHKYGHKRLYDDFVKIYELTNSKINKELLTKISDIASTYNADSIVADIWFTVIYAGMVAEENKEFAILKKRVKRLGMHQLLIERESPSFAANFSKGKKWNELDVIMKDKGF